MLAQDLSVEDVRRMIHAGVKVDRLEELIERLELDPEDEAALWLGAWSNRDRGDRRPTRIPGLYLG
jgi:hypothetical protein